MPILCPNAKDHEVNDERRIQQNFLQAAKITEILTAQGTGICHLLHCYHSKLPAYYLHFVSGNYSPPPLYTCTMMSDVIIVTIL